MKLNVFYIAIIFCLTPYEGESSTVDEDIDYYGPSYEKFAIPANIPDSTFIGNIRTEGEPILTSVQETRSTGRKVFGLYGKVSPRRGQLY